MRCTVATGCLAGTTDCTLSFPFLLLRCALLGRGHLGSSSPASSEAVYSAGRALPSRGTLLILVWQLAGTADWAAATAKYAHYREYQNYLHYEA